MGKTTKMVEVDISLLKPYERNAKLHPEEQIEQIKNSIQEFGFISPCLIDKDNQVIAGHGRILAAKELGMKKVPCIYIEGLTDEQRRAYTLVDNKLTELGGWDFNLLDQELDDIAIDMSDFGFQVGEFNEAALDDLFASSETPEKEPKTMICPHCGETIEL